MLLGIAIIVAEDSAVFSGIHRNIPHGNKNKSYGLCSVRQLVAKTRLVAY
jgi:hypothetical protein